MARNTSVIGIYSDRTTVSDAVSVLHKAGYRPTDVSVMSSENAGTKDFAHERHTRASEGAAKGAVIGALLGAALAWLASTQAATVPGFAPLAAAGPVLAALAGAGAGGAVGWILGLLAGMRLSEYVALRYAGRIRHGGILLSVHCDSPEWCDKAKKVLKDTGARGISCASETTADFGATDRPTERAPVAAMAARETPSALEPQVVVVSHEVRE
jgi:Protein of unknown function (DUF3341)